MLEKITHMTFQLALQFLYLDLFGGHLGGSCIMGNVEWSVFGV